MLFFKPPEGPFNLEITHGFPELATQIWLSALHPTAGCWRSPGAWTSGPAAAAGLLGGGGWGDGYRWGLLLGRWVRVWRPPWEREWRQRVLERAWPIPSPVIETHTLSNVRHPAHSRDCLQPETQPFQKTEPLYKNVRCFSDGNITWTPSIDQEQTW